MGLRVVGAAKGAEELHVLESEAGGFGVGDGVEEDDTAEGLAVGDEGVDAV